MLCLRDFELAAPFALNIFFTVFPCIIFPVLSPVPPTLMCSLNSYNNFHRAIPHTSIILLMQFSIAHLPDHMVKPLATTL